MRQVGQSYEADRRLYFTQDRSRVVEHGDPEAAFLCARPGTLIPAADAERYGLVPKAKARKRPADKSRKPGANKAG